MYEIHLKFIEKVKIRICKLERKLNLFSKSHSRDGNGILFCFVERRDKKDTVDSGNRLQKKTTLNYRRTQIALNK